MEFLAFIGATGLFFLFCFVIFGIEAYFSNLNRRLSKIEKLQEEAHEKNTK